MDQRNNQETPADISESSPPPLFELRAPTEARAHAQKMATRVNLGLIALMILCALLFGGGDLQTTLRYLSEYSTNLMLGAVFVGVLQLFSRRFSSSSQAWYSCHEDRLVFHWPPRREDILFEEIRELRHLPVPAVAWIDVIDAFCLYLRLKNGREIRLLGLTGLRRVWDYLSEKFPEKVVEQSRASDQVSADILPLRTLVWWFFLGGLWSLTCFLLLSENLAVAIMLLGLAMAPTEYLIRYYRNGRPASEDPQAFACLSFLIACFCGAVGLIALMLLD
ncbi:MAG TPA: hypothetical protein PKO06_09045 [Candidatus Ozemobacteraceae bacterium]|nr:hypothetical protein [Candidatus Ozemobacteraceae bacterium]